jgi:triacylglycerol lipase
VQSDPVSEAGRHRNESCPRTEPGAHNEFLRDAKISRNRPLTSKILPGNEEIRVRMTLFQQPASLTVSRGTSMPFSNTQAAQLGLLAMHAMDMHRLSPGSLMPPPAPSLTASGWTILAYLIGSDTLFAKGPLQIDTSTTYYGYVAKQASGELVAVVRGTDGFVEWVEDGEFLPVIYAPKVALPAGSGTVLVERGFWTIYASMQLIDPSGAPLGALAPAIAALVGSAASITVVGHSLGAALATYLILDLARGSLQGRASACLLASPHTGNQAFVDLFDHTVIAYRLFNYILDIVPRVPLLLGYATLPRRTVIQPATAEARIRISIGCNHHVICYCAMLDYEGTIQATTPVPAGEEQSAMCLLGPETGTRTLAKVLVGEIAGVVPV